MEQNANYFSITKQSLDGLEIPKLIKTKSV